MCNIINQCTFDTNTATTAIKCTFYTETATNSTSVFHKWNWHKWNWHKCRRQSRELAYWSWSTTNCNQLDVWEQFIITSTNI